MKKLSTILSILLMCLMVGCIASYDDSEIRSDIEDLQERVLALEEMCREMNSNIDALQAIVTAQQNGDYITNVEPITDEREIIGYTITFAKGNPITIYHGEDGKDGTDGENGKDGQDGTDGKDGYTPQIGVKQDTDNIYYWTLDGEWLLDENGNKIKAQGTDGKDGQDGENGADGNNGANGNNGADGVTPQLKIENDYWYVSYDDGKSWTQLGKATGEKGDKGETGAQGPQGDKGDIGLVGDSMFTDVDYSNEEYVIFTLSNGATIQVPTWYAFEQLRTLYNQMNSNIEALQAIVSALQNNDYVAKVEPVLEDGATIGYVIYFSKSTPVTIYHGEDGKDGTDGENGKDGYTPQISVKQDTDGIYYWTLDGEWLLDENGNKIKAVGTDGKDGDKGDQGETGVQGPQGEQGITPQLKIENDYWYVSYDDGKSWTQLGKATGENGKDGQDGADGANGADGKDGYSFFQSVEQDERFLYLTLSDGSVFIVPRYVELDIVFDTASLSEVRTNSEVEVPYYVTSSSESVTIEAMPSNDLRAEVVGSDKTYKEGYILIRTSSDFDSASRVVVLVTDGEKVIMKSLAITVVEEDRDVAQLYVYNGATKNVSKDGGLVTLSFLTNVECEVVIPEEAQSWISQVQTRALTRQTLTLNVQPNAGSSRSAKVKVQSLDGALSIEYSIVQFGAVGAVDPDVETPADNQIFYTSDNGEVIAPANAEVFGAVLISNDYADGRGVLTFDRPVTHIGDNAFSRSSNLTSIALPNSVTSIGGDTFYYCTSLTSITIPDGVTSIGDYAFSDCSSLTSITIPDSITSIVQYAFKDCTSLTSITIPNSVTSIGQYAFYGCTSLTSITIPDSVTSIGNNAFENCSSLAEVTLGYGLTLIESVTFKGCTSLGSIVIPDSVTYIRSSAFEQCGSLASVTIGAGLIDIYDAAFRYCYFLEDIYCRAITPPTLHGANTFEGLGSSATIYVPRPCVDLYKNAQGWSNYAGQIEGYDYESLTSVQILYTTTDGNIVEPSNLCGILSNTYENGQGVITIAGYDNFLPINKNVFYGCNLLKTITIPDGVTSIKSWAFRSCSSLTSITIPDSVTEIGGWAFSGCSSLAEVYCKPTTPPKGDWSMFDYNASGRKIYVPAVSVKAYRTAQYWSEYADAIVTYDFE